MPSLSQAGRLLRERIAVSPAPVEELRRRRRRRVSRHAVAASIGVAALVAGLVTGIELSSPAQHVVVPAGPAPSSTTATQRTGACTQADLDRPRPTNLPAPIVLRGPMQVAAAKGVTPPRPGQSIHSAVVSAQQVWAHDYIDSMPQVQTDLPAGGGTNEIFLGTYYDGAIGQYRLVWLLERTGVALRPPPFDGVEVGSTSTPSAAGPVCEFFNLDVVVDATTGQELEMGLETTNPAASRTSTPIAPPTGATPPTTETSVPTQQIAYEAFTAQGTIKSSLRVTKTVSGDCQSDGVAGNSSFRCFSTQSIIYDPCFAPPGATSGPLVCPTNPATADVIEFSTGSLPAPLSGTPQQRPWAIQLADGQVCIQINAAWGGLGPFGCQTSPAGPLADCHVPSPGTPWWTAECQTQLTASSPYTIYRVVNAWL
jgi:hypothetical protein